MLNELFWQRVELLRKERGKSQSEVSEFAFKHRNAYRNGLEQKSTPSMDFIDGMARALDVNAGFLMTGFGEESPYIPADVPAPANPDAIFRQAKKIAQGSPIRPDAITLVLSQRPPPDPRLGAERILELFCRADAALAEQERNAAAKKSKAKRTNPKRQRAPG